MRSIWIVLFAFFLLADQAQGSIYSVNSLEEIERETENLDADSLVLFDIDQTLLAPDDAILRSAYDDCLEELMGEKVQVLPGGGKRYLFREIL